MDQIHSPIFLINRFSPLSEETPDTDPPADICNLLKMQKRMRRQYHFNNATTTKNDYNNAKVTFGLNTDFKTKKRIKNKIHIHADSYDNNLGNMLNTLLPKKIKSFVYASSGGTVEHILNNTSKMIGDLTQEDKVVIIVGANNICDVTAMDQTPHRKF